MLIQKHHNAAETHQVSHEAPEAHAVNCALENLDAKGLGRVLLYGSVGSAAQTLVDPDSVGRGERMMAEKSSKCLHKALFRQGVAGCATRVLHQSEKHRNVRTRSKLKKIQSCIDTGR